MRTERACLTEYGRGALGHHSAQGERGIVPLVDIWELGAGG